MAGILLDEPDVVRAWAAAASHVASPGPTPTFIAVTAGNAFITTAEQLHQLDECAHAFGAERPSSVADVLVPRRVLESDGNVLARLGRGWLLLGRCRRRGLKFSGWVHTYFERLTGRWMDKNLTPHDIKENRLASIIEKINLWGHDVEAALYAHTESASDTLRPRGAPCLQYVQFRLFDANRLELFALYRAHDYFNKALGNLIGLQRLGEFVASETGRTYVRQTVFSLHPMTSGSKLELNQLVANVSALPGI